MAEFDLDLQGHLGLKIAPKLHKSAKNEFVHAITFEGLKLGSPNLDNKCIMGRSRMGLYMVEFGVK